jgi:hypothetical protein
MQVKSFLTRVTFGIVGAACLVSVACKGSGPEGTYTLDKGEMTKAMEAEIKTMPADQQGMAKFALGMISAMDITLKVNPGGKCEMTSKMALGGESKNDAKQGDWTLAADVLTLKVDNKTTTCKVDGKKLTCEDGTKKGNKLIFNKQ